LREVVVPITAAEPSKAIAQLLPGLVAADDVDDGGDELGEEDEEDEEDEEGGDGELLAAIAVQHRPRRSKVRSIISLVFSLNLPLFMFLYTNHHSLISNHMKTANGLILCMFVD